MVPITIEKGENNWIACTYDESGKVSKIGTGANCREAVGDLVLTCLESFGVEIKSIKRK